MPAFTANFLDVQSGENLNRRVPVKRFPLLLVLIWTCGSFCAGIIYSSVDHQGEVPYRMGTGYTNLLRKWHGAALLLPCLTPCSLNPYPIFIRHCFERELLSGVKGEAQHTALTSATFMRTTPAFLLVETTAFADPTQAGKTWGKILAGKHILSSSKGEGLPWFCNSPIIHNPVPVQFPASQIRVLLAEGKGLCRATLVTFWFLAFLLENLARLGGGHWGEKVTTIYDLFMVWKTHSNLCFLPFPTHGRRGVSALSQQNNTIHPKLTKIINSERLT